MAQHITSVPELLASQEQGFTPDAGDIVFVVRGSGTYRDIVFSLSQLREFFTTNPDMFKVGSSEWKNVQGTGTSHAPITGFCIYETILYNDDSNYGFQRATAWSSNRCWIRCKTGGNWSAWKEL